MRVHITHESIYDYDQPVPYGLQQLRLTPRSLSGQDVKQWTTSVEGAQKELSFLDHHMNLVELISFDEGGSTIKITSTGVVETSDGAGVVLDSRETCPLWLFQRTTDLTAPGEGTKALASSISVGPDNPLAQLHELTAKVASAIDYRTGNTDSASTAEHALQVGSGVCQDHAHVFISCARLLGCPARYVSGYLVMDDRTNQDASHAWAEAFVPDLGWVGFDVSNGISPDERYVRVAVGLDYAEAAPISGIRFGDGNEHLQVTLQVQQ